MSVVGQGHEDERHGEASRQERARGRRRPCVHEVVQRGPAREQRPRRETVEADPEFHDHVGERRAGGEPVRDPSEEPRTEAQSEQERAEKGRRRGGGRAHHVREEPEPEQLVDERGGPRQEEGGGEGPWKAGWCWAQSIAIEEPTS